MTANLRTANFPAGRLLRKIRERTATVAVIGLGYVGLPLAEALARAGFRTLGFDQDSHKVEQIRRGESYLGHVPSERIRSLVDAGRLDATSDAARLAKADAVLICVPTPLTAEREPDLSFVRAAGAALVPHLRRGQLVILESTTYPGTTEEVLRPLLETSGLRAGVDFFLAYSPEREDPGNPHHSMATIAKVVGACDPAARSLAEAVYRAVGCPVVTTSSIRVAEACKLLENTYRAVNVALINELKVVFEQMGIDVWEVIEAAKTKPFGFQAFYPGPGVGGPCIPKDPVYLSWAARRHGGVCRLVELAGELSQAMPAYVVERVAEALGDSGRTISGSRVCVLGMAYKKNVGDVRASPGLEILNELARLGAVVSYSDPHVARLPAPWDHLASEPLTGEFLADQDCVVIATDHDVFDFDRVFAHARAVVDCRNASANRAGYARVYKA
jgi:UDP-N-acetyl-D-glucosamine dehydrogenase